MLNSNRTNDPHTLGNSLHGEQTTPMRSHSYDLPIGHLIIIICAITLLMLVCFLLGVNVGKHSVPNPQLSKEDGPVSLILLADRIGERLIELKRPTLSYAEFEGGRHELMMCLTEFDNPLSQEDPLQHEEKEENAQLQQTQ